MATLRAPVHRWLREPTLWFALLSAGVFLVHHLRRPDRPDSSTAAITLSKAKIDGLRRELEQKLGRAGTSEELAHRLSAEVEDEILVREARRLELDREDVVIRRRLVQRLELELEELDPAYEPSEDELRDYLARHPARFQEGATVRFRHVFLSRARREEATAVLQQLEAAGNTSPAALGEPFIHGSSFGAASGADLETLFGPGFAAELLRQPLGRWSGPLQSSLGVHLVHVDEVRRDRTASLAEVRPAVRQAIIDEQRQRQREERLRDLEKRYRISVVSAEAQTP